MLPRRPLRPPPRHPPARGRRADPPGAGRRAAALAAVLAVVLGLSACAGTSSPSARTAASVGWHGIEPNPVPSRPHFTLTDTSGAAYDFAARTAGRPTLLYFGYTSCPDECPTAMADVAAALRRSSPALRAQTTVVFVTTDPARDDASRLRAFLDRFDTAFVGLRGTADQVAAAQRAAGVRPATTSRTPSGSAQPAPPASASAHVDAPGTAPHGHADPLGYAVEHTTVIFAYDVDNQLPVLYPSGTTAGDLAADLPLLARPASARPAP